MQPRTCSPSLFLARLGGGEGKRCNKRDRVVKNAMRKEARKLRAADEDVVDGDVDELNDVADDAWVC